MSTTKERPLTTKEATAWLAQHGLVRSLVWVKTLMTCGAIPSFKAGKHRFSYASDLKNILKNPPKMKVKITVVKA